MGKRSVADQPRNSAAQATRSASIHRQLHKAEKADKAKRCSIMCVGSKISRIYVLPRSVYSNSKLPVRYETT
jgi:hypothetical protein